MTNTTYMKEVITTNGDTREDVREKRDLLYSLMENEDCTLEDLEDVIGDGDFADYL